MEPAVFGAASLLKQGEQSKAIVGKTGIFFVKVTAKRTAPGSDIKAEKQMMAQQISSNLANSIYTILKDKAQVVDNRIFYN